MSNEAMGRRFRVVETDNFGRDFPDESFCGPLLTEQNANLVADVFNEAVHPNHPRYWKVVSVEYKLQPGFSP